MNKTLFSWTLLVLCNLMWASQFTCIKLVQDQVGPYFTVWAPMLLAAIGLFPFVAKEFRKGKKKLKDVLVFGQLALLGAFPAQVLMTWGTQFSLASNAAVLSLSLPVVTAIFAFFLLRERMTPLRWISFGIALVGVGLCSVGDIAQLDFSSRYTIGNGLIFLAIIGNAYYNTGCKRVATSYSEIEMVFYTYIAMVILLTPLVFIYESHTLSIIPRFSAQTWTGMLLLTVFHNFLSMVLFFKALKALDAIQVALSNYLITFFGLPIAAIWLGEQLSTLALIGGGLVLLSTLTITLLEYRVNNKQ